MRDQLAQVAGEDALGIMLRLVRLAAEPMRAKIGHDHAEALGRDARRVAELDPVHIGVGKEPVKQDHEPAPPRFMESELDPVGRSPEMRNDVAHPGNFPVACTHLSTSTG